MNPNLDRTDTPVPFLEALLSISGVDLKLVRDGTQWGIELSGVRLATYGSIRNAMRGVQQHWSAWKFPGKVISTPMLWALLDVDRRAAILSRAERCPPGPSEHRLDLVARHLTTEVYRAWKTAQEEPPADQEPTP